MKASRYINSNLKKKSLNIEYYHFVLLTFSLKVTLTAILHLPTTSAVFI